LTKVFFVYITLGQLLAQLKVMFLCISMNAYQYVPTVAYTVMIAIVVVKHHS